MTTTGANDDRCPVAIPEQSGADAATDAKCWGCPGDRALRECRRRVALDVLICGGAMNSKTVLVVEDDDDARGVLCELLLDAGYQCLEAGNGQDAIGRLSAAPERPAVILLDLMMPRMNGWQFREWQRQSVEHSTIPVVILSAATDGAEEAKKLAVADFIPKPIDLNKLLERVQHYCPGG